MTSASPPQICAKCAQGMTGGPILSALDKKWHPACFTCVKCQTELSRVPFHAKDDSPYCSNCWKVLFQPPCATCKVIIEPNEQYVTFNEKAYHTNCFVCVQCNQTLSGKEFVIQDDKFCCPEHISN